MDTLAHPGKWISGCAATMWGLVIPQRTLIVCVMVAIIVDFITGNIADYYRNKRAGSKYAFQSEKMWKTGWKLGLSIIGIGFAWMLDVQVLSNLPVLNLANFFSAFIVGTEFWSFLENAAIISDHQIFRSLKKQMKNQVEKQTDMNFDVDDKNNDNEKK